MIKTNYFQAGSVVDCLESRDKYNAIRELLKKAPLLSRQDQCLIEEAAIARERLMTTGIGRGVAIAHGKTDCVRDTMVLLGISRDGIDFESLDGRPVHLLFLIASHPEKSEEYLTILAALASLLRDDKFTDSLQCENDSRRMEKLIAAGFRAALKHQYQN